MLSQEISLPGCCKSTTSLLHGNFYLRIILSLVYALLVSLVQSNCAASGATRRCATRSTRDAKFFYNTTKYISKGKRIENIICLILNYPSTSDIIRNITKIKHHWIIPPRIRYIIEISKFEIIGMEWMREMIVSRGFCHSNNAPFTRR